LHQRLRAALQVGVDGRFDDDIVCRRAASGGSCSSAASTA
jgi:hypothetical protein